MIIKKHGNRLNISLSFFFYHPEKLRITIVYLYIDTPLQITLISVQPFNNVHDDIFNLVSGHFVLA